MQTLPFLGEFVVLPATVGGVTLATLNLPAGSYALFGRALIFPNTATNPGGNYFGDCFLNAGSDSDEVQISGLFPVTNSPGQPPQFVTSEQEAVLNVLHTFTSPGSVTLACGSSVTGPSIGGNARITAVQVTSIH